jgi:hypothetical protein
MAKLSNLAGDNDCKVFESTLNISLKLGLIYKFAEKSLK